MIRIENLHLTYRSTHGDVHAVRGVDIEVESGCFYTLLGPSGCGKTTTLRCVAGLERPTSGRITVGDQVVYSADDGIAIASYDRNIGMVFQSYAIWPHMSVFDNVAFPLKQMRPRPDRQTIRDRVLRALDLVHLDNLADRPAPYLSGGQQQRLALARALVREPNVLLLDEPLSNLDAKLREEMRTEVRELVETLGVTTLFVTHEQIEALTMSDRIGVMHDGLIVQEGSPTEIYNHPEQAFVADFIGKTNFLTGEVVEAEADAGGYVAVRTPVGILRAHGFNGLDVGASARVAIRPENVIFATENGADSNMVRGTIQHQAFLGNMVDCIVATGDLTVLLQIHPSTAGKVGDDVWLHLPSQSCVVIRD
jgi:iron(III) transport system ATP-binding protein